jgi:phenylalanine-4-hydroxylase
MGSEYLADSQIQGYLVHNIRLRALGWFTIETGLLEDELKNYHTCYVSSISQSRYIITSLIIHILEIV